MEKEKKNNQSILIGVVVVAVATGSFFAGAIYQRNKLASSAMGRFGQNGFMGGQNGGHGAMMGGDANASDLAAGEIIEKDASSITVKTRDGGSKIVYFSKSTTVGKFAKGNASDLKKGQQVMASGKSSGDSLSAKNIQIRP